MTAQSFPPTVFQSFEEKTDKTNVAPRLAALRGAMATAGVDGFLIPRADAHRGESVPPGEARLAYVTGFTGSAGLALVGKDKAGLFEAMMARASQPLRDRVARAIAAQPALPLVELVAVFLEPLKGIAQDQRAAQVIGIATHMVEYTPELAAFRQASTNTQAQVVHSFQKALRSAARQHGVTLAQPAPLAAQVLCATMFGLIGNWVLAPAAFDLPRAGRAALQAHLRGLGFGDATLAPYGLAPRRGKG